MILELTASLPRHAFSVRDRARAGHVWRAFQELAVRGSTACGWPPSRFRAEGAAFVVRRMTVVHHREAIYGEPLSGRTWVADFRRGILTRREIRLLDAEGATVASTSQQWVHVSADLRAVRASPELLEAFPPVDAEPAAALPDWQRLDEPGPPHVFEFEPWHIDMDPLGHANHPAYVDWCDEALSRVLAARGVDPVLLQPVAEEVSWKLSVEAGQQVRVESRIVGECRDALVFEHRILRADAVAATAVLIRRLDHDRTLREVLGD